MNRVSARCTRSMAAASSPAPSHCTGPGAASAARRPGCRAWMYLGQLPKLCTTCTSRPLSPNAATRPFMRLRRRVCGSSPSTPTAAPGARCVSTGSLESGAVAICMRCASGVCTNPGGPASIVAHGWPCSSTVPSSKVGSFSNSSRCWSGMWSRNTMAPTAAMRSRTPTRACKACSPGWNASGGTGTTTDAAGTVAVMPPPARQRAAGRPAPGSPARPACAPPRPQCAGRHPAAAPPGGPARCS